RHHPRDAAAGFPIKTGSTQWNWGRTDKWDLWFSDTDEFDRVWFVDRARFDELLFRNAEQRGAECRQRARVRELVWDGPVEAPETRLLGARWTHGDDPTVHTTTAKFVVDACGHRSPIARAKQLREDLPGLKHQAYYAHFEHVPGLPPPQQHQALFLAGERHWFWLFPISEERTSIGIVMLDDGEKTPKLKAADFDAMLADCARLQPVLGPDFKRCTPVHHQRDWSFRCREVAGPGWFLVGDAAGFVDPILSQGVLQAMNSAYHCAHEIVAIAEDKKTEQQASADYSRDYTRTFNNILAALRFLYRWNLTRDDYFWASKRILHENGARLEPTKSFAILTSGLIRNLALREVQTRRADRWATNKDRGRSLSGPAPDENPPTKLDFICIQFRCTVGDKTGAAYFLIEPGDPTEPALLRTTNWNISYMSRDFYDPGDVPLIRRTMYALGAQIRRWDSNPDESLARFWARTQESFSNLLRKTPKGIELVRVFGE
ncbi:MAG: NAD(P)/FAD-dependent oxidoreductase, partial [Nannocystaceae bacterium]